MGNDNLKRLEELDAQMPGLKDLVENRGKDWVEVEAGNGTTFMFDLCTCQNISVAKAFLSAGSIIEEHVHANEKEWLIVFKGLMDFTVNGQTKTCKPGDFVCVQRAQSHSAIFHEDTWLIAITMPPANGYPGKAHNGKQQF